MCHQKSFLNGKTGISLLKANQASVFIGRGSAGLLRPCMLL